MRALAPRSRDEKIALYGLAALLVAGGTLRLLLMVAWRPAFTGYPDAMSYIFAARGELFGDAFRPAGYPLFMRALHAVSENLSVTILAQHALGLASAIVLFLAVRRCGGPAWLGLVPAAVVLLCGDQAFLEHAPLSEALYVFLLSLTLYAAVRSVDGGAMAWPLLAGALVGLSTTVRAVSLALIPLIPLWLAVAQRAPLRRRLLSGGAALAAAALVLGGYVVAQEQETGYTGLTRSGIWNLYGRVAPFADCGEFDPPSGTDVLCETRPPSERPAPEEYIYSAAESPAVQHYNNPFMSSLEDNARVGAFARTVVLNQPLDYLEAIAEGMVGYVAPGTEGLRLGDSYERFFHTILFTPKTMEETRQWALPYYGDDARGYTRRDGLLDALLRYESYTRVQGPVFVLLALLSLLGPLAATGRARSLALLFAVFTWVLLVAPVATHWFNARYAVPAFGPLAASAAIGGWAIVSWLRSRRARAAG